MRRASTLLLTLALAATALTPARPAAAGPESPTANEAERAHELFEKSKPLQDTKRYAEAAGLLRQAWSLQHSPDIAANLGMCEAAMGLYRDGAEHLAYAQRHIVAGATPEQRAQIKNALEIMKRQVATLRLKVEPAGAEVRVDGKPIGVAPLPPEVFLEPGERRLEVNAPGHRAETRVVAAKKGEAQGVEVVLAAEADSSPLVPSGQADPPKDTQPEQEPGPVAERSMTPVWIGGGVVVLGLASGIGFTLVASGKASKRDDLLGELPTKSSCRDGTASTAKCDEIQTLDDDRVRFRNYGYVGFALAGAAAVGTAAYWFWPRAAEPKSGTVVLPSITTSSASLQVSGRF